MADFTPVALGIKPPQGMSLSDMLNMANVAQQYQQAQQLNPLALQKAQMEVEQAQKMNPLAVQKATAEVSTAETGSEKSKFDLNKSYAEKARGVFGGFANDPDFISGNSKEMVKKLQASQAFLKSMGVPSHPDGTTAQMIELAKTDPKAVRQHISNMTQGELTAESQQALQTPNYVSNAAGNIIGIKKGTNEIVQPLEKVANINPTTADVSLGGEYAKTLQGRVQASNDWLQRSTEMRGIMDEFKPGAGATTYAQLGQKLQAIGAPDDLVNKIANGDLAATQSLQKFMASSIMSAARQSAEGTPFASEVKSFEANNPSVNSDPKTLKRFIDFYDRLAGTSIKENEAMAQAKEKGIYNPGTWQADWQKMGQQQGLLPKTPSGKLPSESSQKQQEKTVVREGTLNGKRVIQYSDGSVRYK